MLTVPRNNKGVLLLEHYMVRRISEMISGDEGVDFDLGQLFGSHHSARIRLASAEYS